ncbi:MAG: hypothetical protein ACI9CU_001428, partial [Polaribacter sp.]
GGFSEHAIKLGNSFSHTSKMRPPKNSYGDYYKNYIALVKEDDLLSA